ncbi:hypothetical protein VTL71DRAFT_9645 [Oculimacula yallundae]|uniref:Uncharacterized protein n=1 Tax=Oculimacula yallundae TaxID=86028 RepID=A0ABR4BRG2_9HELO
MSAPMDSSEERAVVDWAAWHSSEERLVEDWARTLDERYRLKLIYTLNKEAMLHGSEAWTVAIYDIIWDVPRSEDYINLARGDLPDRIEFRREEFPEEVDEEVEKLWIDTLLDGEPKYYSQSMEVEVWEQQIHTIAPPPTLTPLPLNVFQVFPYNYYFRYGKYEIEGHCQSWNPDPFAREPFRIHPDLKGYNIATNEDMVRPDFLHMQPPPTPMDQRSYQPFSLLYKENVVDDSGRQLLGFCLDLGEYDVPDIVTGWAKLREGLDNAEPASMCQAEEQRLTNSQEGGSATDLAFRVL